MQFSDRIGIQTTNDKLQGIARRTSYENTRLAIEGDDTLDRLIAKKREQDRASIQQIAEFAITGVIKVGSGIHGLIVDEQSSEAGNFIDKATSDLTNSINNSIFNGSTRFVEDESGNLTLQLSEEVEERYREYLKQIEEANWVKSVKNNAISLLSSKYSALSIDANTQLLNNAYQNRNSQFVTGLANDLESDAMMLSQHGGKFTDANGETLMFGGIARIEARTDWDETTKKEESSAYLRDVYARSVEITASNIATGTGLPEALEYIRSAYANDPEKANQVFSVVYTASRNQQIAIGGVAQEIATGVADYLSAPTEDYQGPRNYEEAYSYISNTLLQGASREVHQAAYEAMREQQTEDVTAMFSNRIVQDSDKGLSALESTFENIISGTYDSYFVEIPEVKVTFAEKYQSEIESKKKSIASALKTNASTVESADKDVLDTYTKTVNYAKANVEAGTMKPADAVATVGAVGQATAESLQLSTSHLSYQASQIEFLNDLVDYVPATWKPALKSKLDQAYATLSLTGSKLTPEQIERKNNLSDFTTGIVADILYNNENFTLDDALAAVDEITKANLLTRSIKGTTKWPEVKDPGEGNFAGNLDDAIDFNDFAANNTSMLYVVYDDDADAALESASTGQPAAPKLKWMDPELEQTFNNASQILKVQISALTGVDEAKISYAPENQNGLLVPSPVFAVPTASGIDAYRVRGESIQVYSDSGWKTVAQVSKNLKQVESQGMFLQVRKEAAQGRIDRNSNPATMETSDSWKRTNLWALDPRKTIEEAGSRQKAQQLVDKLVRESGDDAQLRGELEGYIREIYG